MAIRKKSYSRPEPSLRANRRIRIPQVRVIGADGEQLGILDTREALKIAQDAGLDLVEISPTARPPVCRILDFGKYQYEESKNQKKAKKRQTSSQMKEMRFRPKIDEHDIQFKTNRLREFLLEGHKVRAYVEFRGREMTHTEFGHKIIERIKDMLADVGVPESSRMEGRRMSVIIDPKKGVVKPKKEESKRDKGSDAKVKLAEEGTKRQSIADTTGVAEAKAAKAEAKTPEAKTADTPAEEVAANQTDES